MDEHQSVQKPDEKSNRTNLPPQQEPQPQEGQQGTWTSYDEVNRRFLEGRGQQY